MGNEQGRCSRGDNLKGIVLAGGSGTRLYPLTRSVSKQMLPVYDKPMIYYPLSVLMLGGIRDILIISTPRDLPRFKELLGDGSHFGVSLAYAEQQQPNGLAEAFIIGREFVGDDTVAMILGDNIFYGHGISQLCRQAAELQSGAAIFAYRVEDPEQYGVVDFEPHTQRARSITEKPISPASDWAVTGLYFYDNEVMDIARTIKPSSRGELEITAINNVYLERDQLRVHQLGRGFAWLDTGTHDSLHEASSFVRTIEHRQGIKMACLEEIGLANKWLAAGDVLKRVSQLDSSPYTDYLRRVVRERT